MTVDAKRYPNSTADGRSIPFDIRRPRSIIPVNFADGVDSGAVAIPDGVEMLDILCSANCIITFGGAATALVNLTEKADSYYLFNNFDFSSTETTAEPVSETITTVEGDTTVTTNVVLHVNQAYTHNYISHYPQVIIPIGTTLHARGDGTSGRLIIRCLDKFAGLSLNSQAIRR